MSGEIPASLIYMLIVSPSAAVPSTFMPLPFRNTLAGRPVVLDTALLPASVLPLSAEETRSDCLCPDGCAPRGNVRYIAATFAAATVVVPENSGRLQNQQDTGRLSHIVTWKNSGTNTPKGPLGFSEGRRTQLLRRTAKNHRNLTYGRV